MSTQSVQQLGPYTLLRQIGEGGMGQVFVGYKKGSDGKLLPYAVKTLKPDSAKPSLVTHLGREAKFISNLKNENIATFYEFGIEYGQYFLAMEYVEGLSLKRLLDDHTSSVHKLELNHIVFIASQILTGVEYLHRFKDPQTGEAHQIIHGDLSPSNVIINFEGAVKLIDFGLAAYPEDNNSTKFMNPFYGSPKRLESGMVSVSDDIFSFGIILWEMLTAKRYYGENPSDIHEEVRNFTLKDPRRVVPTIPENLAQIVIRCLNVENTYGYQSIFEVMRDVSAAKDQVYPPATKTSLQKFMTTKYEGEFNQIKRSKGQYLEMLTGVRPNTLTSPLPNSKVSREKTEEIPPEEKTRKILATTVGEDADNQPIADTDPGFKTVLVPLGPQTLATRKPVALPNAVQSGDTYLRQRTKSNFSLLPTKAEFIDHLRKAVLLAVLMFVSTILYIQKETAKTYTLQRIEKVKNIADQVSKKIGVLNGKNPDGTPTQRDPATETK